MISTVGIGVLSLSIIGFGFSYNRGLKNEKECVEGLIQLTERINTRIKCFRQGISEIYDCFSNPFLDATGFTAALKEKGMTYALESSGDKLTLGHDIMFESKKFADRLGKSYYDEQLTLCENYLSFLKGKYDEICRGLPTKTKLSLSLSFAISALSAILFI
ncbi:MAG: hypothetical protein E7648_03670 [Ruminococcaceae bacterium]|nr:hypothetical protein [Oscillospiraceae bacterium]